MGSQIILCDFNRNTSTVIDNNNSIYLKIKCWFLLLPESSNCKEIGIIEEIGLNNDDDKNNNYQLQSSSNAYIISIITKEPKAIDLNYIMNTYKEINVELVKRFNEDNLTCYCILFTMNNLEKTNKQDKEYINSITKQFTDMAYYIQDNVKQMYNIENNHIDMEANDTLNKNDGSLLISSLIESYIEAHDLSIVANSFFDLKPKERESMNSNQDNCNNQRMHLDLNKGDNQMIIEEEQNPSNNRKQMNDEEEEPIEDLDDELFELPTQRRQLEQSNNTIDINNDITEVINNFLYLGNYKIAKNLSALKEKGITHIINCSSDTCDNSYNNEIAYLHFPLKDSISESIECIFYYSFEFIQRCREANGKILIHCYQGISRSASIVIAYLIYNNSLTCDEAFNYVQNLRSMINPNISFFLQLELFAKRIDIQRKRDKDVLMFSVGSIQRDIQLPLVCRLIYENISSFSIEIPILPDKGLYLLTSSKENYILIGKNISPMNKEEYMKTVIDYYKLLVKYEHCKTNEPIVIDQMSDQNVLIILELLFEFGNGPNSLNQYLIDLTNSDNNKEAESKSNQMLNDKGKHSIRKAFYFYPNQTSYNVLSFDDLSSEELIIACVDQETIGNIIHIWEGEEAKITQKDANDYIEYVKTAFFTNQDNIVEIIEVPYEESEEFINLL